jgi:hypothetical protein
MVGSLLLCQQLQATDEDVKKLTGGSSLSPDDLLQHYAQQATSEQVSALTESLRSSEEREKQAKIEQDKERKISTAIAVGGLLVAVSGLYLSWRSSHQAPSMPPPMAHNGGPRKKRKKSSR